jgi:hypothetical protein
LYAEDQLKKKLILRWKSSFPSLVGRACALCSRAVFPQLCTDIITVLDIAEFEDDGCCIPLPWALAGMFASLCFSELPIPGLLGAMVMLTHWVMFGGDVPPILLNVVPDILPPNSSHLDNYRVFDNDRHKVWDYCSDKKSSLELKTVGSLVHFDKYMLNKDFWWPRQKISSNLENLWNTMENLNIFPFNSDFLSFLGFWQTTSS